MSVHQGPGLGVLQRLGSGRSIEAFQQNLLDELRSVLLWDHAIPTTPDLKTLCPSGLWHTQDIPCKICRAWCSRVTEMELMEVGVLFMLNLKARSSRGNGQEISSLGVLLLRRDYPFNTPEIETLTSIHQALQILLEQSIALDWLIQKNIERETIENPRLTDHRPISLNRQTIDLIDHSSKIMENLSDPLFLELGLTPRQSEVIHLIMKGNGISTIAQSIGCSEATVRKHLENLYRRLGVQNRTAAIAHILGKIGVV